MMFYNGKLYQLSANTSWTLEKIAHAIHSLKMKNHYLKLELNKCFAKSLCFQISLLESLF
jgi:hypothetical protein